MVCAVLSAANVYTRAIAGLIFPRARERALCCWCLLPFTFSFAACEARRKPRLAAYAGLHGAVRDGRCGQRPRLRTTRAPCSPEWLGPKEKIGEGQRHRRAAGGGAPIRWTQLLAVSEATEPEPRLCVARRAEHDQRESGRGDAMLFAASTRAER